MSRQIKEFLSILPGSPLGANVVEGNVHKAIQRWKRKGKDSGLVRELYERQEYVKPSTLRRRVKHDAIYAEKRRKGL